MKWKSKKRRTHEQPRPLLRNRRDRAVPDLSLPYLLFDTMKTILQYATEQKLPKISEPLKPEKCYAVLFAESGLAYLQSISDVYCVPGDMPVAVSYLGTGEQEQ